MSIDYFRKCIKAEDQLGFSDIVIWGIPVWRIVRSRIRSKNVLSKKKDILLGVKNTSLRRAFISTCLFFIKVVFTNKSVDNVIQAKVAQSKIEDLYMDKISDPVIAESDLSKSCLILQLSALYPRFNEDKVLDYFLISRFLYVISVFLLPVLLLFRGRKIYQLYCKVVTIYRVSRVEILFSLLRISGYLISVFFWNLILRKMKVKRVFVVGRRDGVPLIVAAKKANIPTYELQHGITFRETVTYGGIYDSRLDPDYFLTFGSKWMGTQFGMPLERLINIGWAYNVYLRRYSEGIEKKTNSVLFISEPHITQRMIETIIEVATAYPMFEFNLRLHPMERVHVNQLKMIEKYSNVSIVSNQRESTLAMLEYYWIVGEKSTVMYEAVSNEIKIGLLCYNGFEPFEMEEKEKEYFYFLTSVADFDDFLSSAYKSNARRDNPYYSLFNKELVENLPK